MLSFALVSAVILGFALAAVMKRGLIPRCKHTLQRNAKVL